MVNFVAGQQLEATSQISSTKKIKGGSLCTRWKRADVFCYNVYWAIVPACEARGGTKPLHEYSASSRVAHSAEIAFPHAVFIAESNGRRLLKEARKVRSQRKTEDYYPKWMKAMAKRKWHMPNYKPVSYAGSLHMRLPWMEPPYLFQSQDSAARIYPYKRYV